jgi:beta-glucanase (GH16 family)
MPVPHARVARARKTSVTAITALALLSACAPPLKQTFDGTGEHHGHGHWTTTTTTRPAPTTTQPAVPPPSATTTTTIRPVAPTTTTTHATTTTTAAPPTTHYLFDDEFDGTSLDLSKWRPNWLAGSDSAITKPVNGAEQSCYDPANVAVPGDGYLHLRAVARSCTANNGTTYPYASGLVESAHDFTFTFGHMEARIWLPGGSGGLADNWGAFWADGTGTWPTTGELDVMETLDGRDCYHFHSPSGGPGSCPSLGNAAGWHVFAADWSSGAVTFTYDGARVGSISSGITSSPMFLILNLAVSSSISPPIVAPSEMLVDYVRVSA